jgi:hypothetical protein
MRFSLVTKLLICILSLTAFFTFPNKLFAQTVSPPIVDFRVDPGQVVEGSVLLENSNGYITEYSVSFWNFYSKGESGYKEFFTTSDSFSSNEWFATTTQTILLGPHEKRDVYFRLSVPQNARSGGHYVAMLFSATNTTEVLYSDTRVLPTSKSGTLFYLRVSGDVLESAKIENFGSFQNSNSEYFPVVFDFKFSNLGNVHLKPKGYIIVKNIFGKESARLPINLTEEIILPNSAKHFDARWTKDAFSARSFISKLKNEIFTFTFGRYTAVVQAEYGENGAIFSNEIHFWIIPWTLLVIFFASVVLVYTAAKQYKKILVLKVMRRKTRQS